MNRRQQASFRKFLHKVALGDASSIPDDELLQRFVGARDEAAFELLVQRYGPLVLRVSRRVRINATECDDIFQATFALLAQRAGSVKKGALGPWLHSVAVHLAAKSKRSGGRRRTHELRAGMPAALAVESDAMSRDTLREMQELLDEEIARLPDKFRLPVILCYLEEKTQVEAARQLDISHQTLGYRLQRGLDMLRERLSGRGVELTSILTLALLAKSSDAAVSRFLILETVRNAMLFSQGIATTGGSAAIAALATEGLVAIPTTGVVFAKLHVVIAVVLLAGVTAGTVTVAGLSGGKTSKVEVAETKRADSRSGIRNHESVDPSAVPANPVDSPSITIEHESPVWCMGWSGDGRWLATGTEDGKIRIIEAASGWEAYRFTTAEPVAAIALSPDGKTIIIAYARTGELHIIDVYTAKALNPEYMVFNTAKVFKRELKPGELKIAFQADGRTAAVAGLAGDKSTWKTCILDPFIPAFVGAWFVFHESGKPAFGCGAIAADAKFAGCCDLCGEAHLRDLYPWSKDGEETKVFLGNAPLLAIGPGGKVLASAGNGTAVRVIDPKMETTVATLAGLPGPASQLSFALDGCSIVALADDDKSIRVWDLRTSGTRCQIAQDQGKVTTLGLSPNGQRLATASGSKVFIWRFGHPLAQRDSLLVLSPTELDELWADLGSSDHKKVDAAFRQLRAAGENAVPFLRTQLRAAIGPSADVPRVDSLAEQLDAESFAIDRRQLPFSISDN